MKPVEDVTCLCADYGTFICLAEKLAETYKKVYYYAPIDAEYRDAQDWVIGDGLPKVERVHELVTPELIKEVDLWVFPDIGWGGFQKYLRSIGKAVWGPMGADELELYRTKFLKVVESLGLPVAPYKVCRGLTELSDYLKENTRKWVKINVFRQNMETWFHLDWEHSRNKLNEMACCFGGVSEEVVFVVQDEIESDVEIGYDGWSVDGKYPNISAQGYEKKNELYLGSTREYDDLPELVKVVNESFGPILESYGYRNFFATEIRVKDDLPYFTDPTLRMPGQTGEQLLESCANLGIVIWEGANGTLIEPTFSSQFLAEATLHYTGDVEGWKTVKVPEEVRQWIKLAQFCLVDGRYEFPPHANDEVGVVLGLGDSIENAIDHLKDNLESLGDEPVEAHLDGFKDLIESIEEAEKEGMEFTDDPLPDPKEVISS